MNTPIDTIDEIVIISYLIIKTKTDNHLIYKSSYNINSNQSVLKIQKKNPHLKHHTLHIRCSIYGYTMVPIPFSEDRS